MYSSISSSYLAAQNLNETLIYDHFPQESPYNRSSFYTKMINHKNFILLACRKSIVLCCM